MRLLRDARNDPFLVREIGDGEFFMILLSSFVIRLGCSNLIVEKAEVFVLAVDSNGCAPFFLACVVRDAFVL